MLANEEAPDPKPDQSSFLYRFFGPKRALRLRRTPFIVGLLVLSVATITGYVQLGTAARQPIPDQQNETQLLRQLHERGQLISKSLRPAI